MEQRPSPEEETLEAADQESRSRCPTAIVRSRNWLLTSLDEHVRSDEASLDRDLDDAIGSVRQWRTDQARRLETMRKDMLSELSSAAHPASSEAAGDDSLPSRCIPHQRPKVQQKRRPESPDENVCDSAAPGCGSSRVEPTATRVPQPTEFSRTEHAVRLGRLDQSADGYTLPTVRPPEVVGRELGIDLEAWLREDEEMERRASELLTYSSNLDQVISSLHRATCASTAGTATAGGEPSGSKLATNLSVQASPNAPDASSRETAEVISSIARGQS